jgi:hypothetical protein
LEDNRLAVECSLAVVADSQAAEEGIHLALVESLADFGLDNNQAVGDNLVEEDSQLQSLVAVADSLAFQTAEVDKETAALEADIPGKEAAAVDKNTLKRFTNY